MPRTARVQPNRRAETPVTRAQLTTEVVTRPTSPLALPAGQPNRLAQALSAISPSLNQFVEKKRNEFITEEKTKGALDAELDREPPEGSTAWRMKQYVLGKATVAAREDASELYQLYETFNPDEWEDPEAALKEAVTNFERERLEGIDDKDYIQGYLPTFQAAKQKVFNAFTADQVKQLHDDQKTLGVQLTQYWVSDKGVPTRPGFEQHRAGLMRHHGLTRDEANDAIIDAVGRMAIQHARPDMLDFADAPDKDGVSLSSVTGVRNKIIGYRQQAEAALAHAQKSRETKLKAAQKQQQDDSERSIIKGIFEGKDMRQTIADSKMDPSRIQSLLSFASTWMTDSKSIVDDPGVVSDLVARINAGGVGIQQLNTTLMQSAAAGGGLSYDTYFTLLNMVEERQGAASSATSQLNAYTDMEQFLGNAYQVGSNNIFPTQAAQLSQREAYARAAYQRMSIQWMNDYREEHDRMPNLSSLESRDKLQEIANKAIEMHPPPKAIIGEYYRPSTGTSSAGSQPAQSTGVPPRYRGPDAISNLFTDRMNGKVDAEEFTKIYNTLTGVQP